MKRLNICCVVLTIVFLSAGNVFAQTPSLSDVAGDLGRTKKQVKRQGSATEALAAQQDMMWGLFSRHSTDTTLHGGGGRSSSEGSFVVEIEGLGATNGDGDVLGAGNFSIGYDAKDWYYLHIGSRYGQSGSFLVNELQDREVNLVLGGGLFKKLPNYDLQFKVGLQAQMSLQSQESNDQFAPGIEASVLYDHDFNDSLGVRARAEYEGLYPQDMASHRLFLFGGLKIFQYVAVGPYWERDFGPYYGTVVSQDQIGGRAEISGNDNWLLYLFGGTDPSTSDATAEKRTQLGVGLRLSW